MDVGALESAEDKTGDNAVNNEQYNKEEEPRDARLTTATLADTGEPTAPKKNLELRARETEAQRKEMGAGEASTMDGIGVAAAGAGAAIAKDEQAGPLFLPEEATKFRARWDAIQGAFVDEPRRAVEQADSLVAEAVKRLAEIFADERAKLDGQWDRGDSVSTEDLRLALRRYRAFFGRLLSV
jgi:hypothetical protein